MKTPKPKSIACALTIAGSDSGGGAGIQADLKTFAALGVHGTSAITCITAQNPRGVIGIQAIRADMVQKQVEAVFAELPPRAIKTGMLLSTEIIETVAGCLAEQKRTPLVVDPVMVATSGAVLLKPSAIRVLREKLLPLATLTTPNLPEAEMLVARKLTTLKDLHDAAREIHERFGCAVLAKGGHLPNASKAMDVFHGRRGPRLLVAPFTRGVSTHGTGCTYAAAITGYLALRHPLPRAVELAKRYITQAIARSQRNGPHFVLDFLQR
jgi:hydroxymethylpyrimidine/phosphomethylpyrimidine kinase